MIHQSVKRFGEKIMRRFNNLERDRTQNRKSTFTDRARGSESQPKPLTDCCRKPLQTSF
jgi:hypothetical protein